MHILDYGCGPGFFTLEAARLAGPTGKITAADIQEGMLALVREKIRISGLKNIETKLVGQDESGIQGSFDLVILFTFSMRFLTRKNFLSK